MTQTAIDLWNDRVWLFKRWHEQQTYLSEVNSLYNNGLITTDRVCELQESAIIQRDRIKKRLEYLGVVIKVKDLIPHL